VEEEDKRQTVLPYSQKEKKTCQIPLFWREFLAAILTLQITWILNCGAFISSSYHQKTEISDSLSCFWETEKHSNQGIG
jgi:hypothetical protein